MREGGSQSGGRENCRNAELQTLVMIVLPEKNSFSYC